MRDTESEAKPADPKADCYADGERAAMEYTQRVRGSLFAPLLRLLTRLHVTPDHLTLVSLLMGLAACAAYGWSKPAAFALLALHVLLDGLDGPLARHRGMASRGGSFTDTMADQTVITATTLTLMYTKEIGLVPGVLYIVMYTVVVLFAMARNALNAPYSWLLRPRFYVYAWFLVETYWLPGSIDYLLWACNAVLALKVLTGFLRIRKKL